MECEDGDQAGQERSQIEGGGINTLAGTMTKIK